MKKTVLLYNAKAGSEKYSREYLINTIRSKGYDCDYLPIEKESLKQLPPSIDFLIVAGGDGTLRTVVSSLLDRKLIDKQFPIALLPAGTANNFAKTLNIAGEIEKSISQWKNHSLKKIDIGKLYYLQGENFFLESFGYGIFPQLILQMRDQKEELKDTAQKKTQTAFRVLHEIIHSYPAAYCSIEIDGVDHSGHFLLVEVMNTCSVGPNLNFAPFADPGDGILEVILIGEGQRSAFASYIRKKMENKEETFLPRIIKGKKIRLKWHGKDIHIDDELAQQAGTTETSIILREGLLEFLVPYRE